MSEFEKKKSEARKRVDGMDAVAKIKDRDPLTIMSALECGLKNPITDASYDALVMLEDVVNANRTKD